MKSERAIILTLVLMLLAAHSSPVVFAQDTTYHDPFAYCEAVGTIDAPDARYVGPKVPESIALGLQQALQVPNAPSEFLVNNSVWRCMEGKVFACSFGANIPCLEKAETSRTPAPPLTEYCKQNPNAEFIPAVVTGRATVYEWQCENGSPSIARQLFQPDARGFLSHFWYELSPGGAQHAIPATGGTMPDLTAWFALGLLTLLSGFWLLRKARQAQ